MAAARQLGHRNHLARSRPRRRHPGPVHQALLKGDMPVTSVASSLGISADHMRQILRHHPLPMPLRPIRRHLYPQAQQPAPHPAQNPDALRIDLDWLSST